MLQRMCNGVVLGAVLLMGVATGCENKATVTPPKVDTSQMQETGESNAPAAGAGRQSDGSVETPVESSSDSMPK